MLKYQQERQNSTQANSGPGATGAESSAPKVNSVMNGESLEDIRKVTANNTSKYGGPGYIRSPQCLLPVHIEIQTSKICILMTCYIFPVLL